MDIPFKILIASAIDDDTTSSIAELQGKLHQNTTHLILGWHASNLLRLFVVFFYPRSKLNIMGADLYYFLPWINQLKTAR